MFSQGRKLLKALKEKTTDSGGKRNTTCGNTGDAAQSRTVDQPPVRARKVEPPRTRTIEPPGQSRASRQPASRTAQQTSKENVNPTQREKPNVKETAACQQSQPAQDKRICSNSDCDHLEYTPSECALLNPKWLNPNNDSIESDSSPVQPAHDSLFERNVSDRTTPKKQLALLDSTNPAAKVKQWLFKPETPNKTLDRPVTETINIVVTRTMSEGEDSTAAALPEHDDTSLFDKGIIVSPNVVVNIDTVEVTPDQPVVGLVAVEVHDGQRKGPTQKVNSTTVVNVRKQLFEADQIVAAEDILVLPLEDDVVIERNVFNGEVVPADNDIETEVEVQDGTNERAEKEPTLPTNKRTRKPNNNSDEEPPSKKRKLKPSSWKANQTKLAYNSGLAHTSLRGKVKAARSMKDGCGGLCRKKCQSKVSEQRREQLFKQFWNLKDKMLQWYFLSKLVRTVNIQRRTVVEGGNYFRTNNYEYDLVDNEGNIIPVCQKMFLATFDISLTVVRTAVTKNSPDKRGKHNNHPKKLSAGLLLSVKNHIKSFPMVESHYCRADTKRKYLDEHLSVAKMHRLYMMTRNPQDQDTATLRQYRDIFNSYFNLSFFQPKKDQCSLCEQWKSAKEDMQEKYDEHQNSKKFVRDLKKQDKERSKEIGSNMRVLTCDMQKVLYCPKSELGEFYYKRKLSVYNFTVYDCTVSQGILYVWDETIGNKGSDETSSFSQHYIVSLVTEHGVVQIVIYSDSCGGQNKNKFLFTMYYAIAMKYKITIIQRYLEKGHTQMECDSVHARVEKKIKKEDVFVPSQYYGYMRTAKVKKPSYVVHEAKQSDIYNYRDLASHLLWDKVQISKLKEIQIGPTPGIVKFKHSWNEELREMPILAKKVGRNVRWDTVKPALSSTQPHPVRPKLKKDLAWMVKKGYIPQEFIPTYNKWSSEDPTDTAAAQEEENDLPVEIVPTPAVENELLQRSYENHEYEMANPLIQRDLEENEDDPEEKSGDEDDDDDDDE